MQWNPTNIENSSQNVGFRKLYLTYLAGSTTAIVNKIHQDR